MSRTKTLFFCTECGNESPRWEGQCPACRGWNTLREAPVEKRKPGTAAARAAAGGSVVRLADVGGADLDRWTSGIPELDFVLGGGLVPASVVLVGGEPGIGKSTILLQAAGRLVAGGRGVLYVTGEESTAQLRMRADRLDEPTDELQVLAETELATILERARAARPDVLLVDSIQTVFSSGLEGVPGSVAQVRECAARFHRFAKEEGMTVFLVGHVTKAGGIAGPKTLEHIVDTVLYFEAAGGADHRVLRATKNRFGGVDEIGVFRMTGSGLLPVGNPSELFLGDRASPRTGSAVAALMEGSRPLLVEIQALATRAPYGAPQRVAAGYDHKRLALLLAVLEKRVGVPFGQLDVFLNVVGGFRITEPSADAAVALALVSTVRDQAIDPATVVVGEVGLGGEIRGISQLERRLAEAGRMGFSRALVPPARSNANGAGMAAFPVGNVGELVDRAFG